MRFLRWKYGLEEPPPEVRPKTLEDIKHEDELIAEVKAGKLVEKEPVDISLRAIATVDPLPVKPVVEKAPVEIKAKETPLVTPMPGMIIRYQVKVGDEVKADDVVVVLEAMKMANALTTPIDGRVKAINFKDGDSVATGDVLAIIG